MASDNRRQYSGKPNNIAKFRPRKMCKFWNLFTANSMWKCFRVNKRSTKTSSRWVAKVSSPAKTRFSMWSKQWAYFLQKWHINMVLTDKKGGTLDTRCVYVEWHDFQEQKISQCIKENTVAAHRCKRCCCFGGKWSYALWDFFLISVRLLVCMKCFDLLFVPCCVRCLYLFEAIEQCRCSMMITHVRSLWRNKTESKIVHKKLHKDCMWRGGCMKVQLRLTSNAYIVSMKLRKSARGLETTMLQESQSIFLICTFGLWSL